jgi:hypothetical protein
VIYVYTAVAAPKAVMLEQERAEGNVGVLVLTPNEKHGF